MFKTGRRAEWYTPGEFETCAAITGNKKQPPVFWKIIRSYSPGKIKTKNKIQKYKTYEQKVKVNYKYMYKYMLYCHAYNHDTVAST